MMLEDLSQYKFKKNSSEVGTTFECILCLVQNFRKQTNKLQFLAHLLLGTSALLLLSARGRKDGDGKVSLSTILFEVVACSF